jgi:acyl-CoA thioester hydrolase
MSEVEPHRLQLRVYYEDTDAGGIVYHAAYLRFAERARTEMLRAAGFDHVSLRSAEGVLFAVRRLSALYLSPARLDDLLTVETWTRQVGGARLSLSQDVLRATEVLVRLEVELAVLGRGLRPARLPTALRQRLGGMPQE